ncbi:hypothetical protein MHH56_12835 [Paenibacillus sp. FSL K6-3182]
MLRKINPLKQSYPLMLLSNLRFPSQYPQVAPITLDKLRKERGF